MRGSSAAFRPQPKIKVTLSQAMRILIPFFWHKIKEQIIIVVPVCLYLAFVQFTLLQYGLTKISAIIGGICVVILGLAFFLEGVRIGLVPVGETIGDTLPRVCSVRTVLLFAFILGNLAAFGEPVIGSLQMAGAGIDPQRAPLLHKLLVRNSAILTLTISLAVGVAVVIGTARFIFNWSLKPLVLPLVAFVIVLTLFSSQNQNLATAVGLAWDTGAVIVGPVLCPLVLALGSGVCRATGKADSGMAGFGLVGLISIVPIAAVILLSLAFGLISTETTAARSVRAFRSSCFVAGRGFGILDAGIPGHRSHIYLPLVLHEVLVEGRRHTNPAVHTWCRLRRLWSVSVQLRPFRRPE